MLDGSTAEADEADTGRNQKQQSARKPSGPPGDAEPPQCRGRRRWKLVGPLEFPSQITRRLPALFGMFRETTLDHVRELRRRGFLPAWLFALGKPFAVRHFEQAQ